MNATSQDIELMGAAIIGVADAVLNRDTVLKDFERRAELDALEDGNYYDLSLYNDLCDYLEERMGQYAFLRVGRKMGRRVMDTAFPDSIDTVQDGIGEVDRAHQIFCRPVQGKFDIVDKTPGQVKIEYSAPYNCILQEGLFYEVAIRFGAPQATVKHTSCRRTGAPACVFDVEW